MCSESFDQRKYSSKMELCLLFLVLLAGIVPTQGADPTLSTNVPLSTDLLMSTNMPVTGVPISTDLSVTTVLPVTTDGLVITDLAGHPVATVLPVATDLPVTTDLRVTTDVLVSTSTTAASPCTPNYCLNSGVCVDVLGKPVCACVEGATGTHCQQLTCPAGYCINPGVCVVVVGRPVCACPAGVTGVHCEVTITTTTTLSTPSIASSSPVSPAATTPPSSLSVCDNNPCIHGICTPLEHGRYSCTCYPGYHLQYHNVGFEHDFPMCLAGTTQIATTTTTTTSTTIPTSSAPQCDTSVFDGCEEAEVVFMITYSSHEDSGTIDHEGDYIRALIENYRIGNGHVRVGVVVYHDDVTEAVHITDYAGDTSGLLNRVHTLTTSSRHQLRPSGEPDIARALAFVRDNSFKAARPGAKKVVIAITHELPCSDDASAVAAANSLKLQCVQIFARTVSQNAISCSHGDIAARIATSSRAPYYTLFDSYGHLEHSVGHHHLGCRH